MKALRAVTGLLILTLLLALVPGAGAQGQTFGLSPEDAAALSSAAAATAAATSAQFNFVVNLTYAAGGDSTAANITGFGAYDRSNPDSPVFSLTVNGTADANGEQTPINAEVRMVNGSLFVNSPMMGLPTWLELSASDVSSFSQMLPVDPTALEGNLPATGGNDMGLGAIGSMLSSIRAEDYVRMTRNGDQFTTSVDVNGLLSSPDVQDAIVQFMEANQSDSSTGTSPEELRQLLAQLPQAMQGTVLTLDQYVTNGMITRATFTLSLTVDPSLIGEQGEPGSLALTFDLSFSGFNQPVTVEVPADAMTLQEMMQGMMEQSSAG